MNDSPDTRPAIEFRNVSYRLNGEGKEGRELLHDLNLEVQRGETLVLLGRSGSGKTTTLKLINHLLTPSEGELLRRRASDSRVGRNPPPPHDRLRHPGSRPVPPLHGGAQYRPGSEDRELARRSNRRTRPRIIATRRTRSRNRLPLSPRTFRRPAPAGRRGPRSGCRSAHPPHGRALRRARSHHPRRTATRISRICRSASAKPSSSSLTTCAKPCYSAPASR